MTLTIVSKITNVRDIAIYQGRFINDSVFNREIVTYDRSCISRDPIGRFGQAVGMSTYLAISIIRETHI